MLEGTDISSAYQTLYNIPMNENEVEIETTAHKQDPPKSQSKIQQPRDDSMMINKQYDNDQKMAVLVAELKKKKEAQATSAALATPEQPSYIDKLFGKRKELYKVLQLSLMITLGISIHFLIDYYLAKYLSENEMSFERQLILRLLYPSAVIFILWNMRVFIK